MPDLFDYTPPPPAPRYPDAPGFKDRDTSRTAAGTMKDAAPLLRSRCLAAIKASSIAGLTADEVADRIGETILSTRPRLTELLHLGQIVDSGLRRKNASGRSAKVWRAV